MHEPGAAPDTHKQLVERIKELSALRQVARLVADRSIGVEGLIEGVTALIPPAFQFPAICGAAVRYDAHRVTTPGFVDSPWRLLASFRTRDGTEGQLEVVYREARPAAAEGPFLVEERHLIDAVAEVLQAALDQRLAEERVHLLLHVTNVVTAELDFEALLIRISTLLLEDIGHRVASLVLWDEQETALKRHALIAADGTPLTATNAPVLPGSPAETAFRTRRAQVFRWNDFEALGEPFVSWMRSHGLRTICAVPLLTARGCHGALAVARSDDLPYEAQDVALLEQVSRPVAVAIENALAYRRLTALSDRLLEENVYLQREVTRDHEFKDIVGHSRALTAVLAQARTVAATNATVLLLGETGTGKELIARAIHDTSRRRAGPFIRINSAALPMTLVESELFGYERGAFTGALAAKAGRLELAHRGTLFLDEVGELPLEVQPKLLRAVQEREFERLGATGVRRVDVRLIAATNRDLEEMVERGTFRSDLYYRLSVFPIRVPPLRERPEDIPSLVRHFVAVFSRDLGRKITTIPKTTMEALQRWPWPGNIRELQNVIERAVILSSGGSLEVPQMMFKVRGPRVLDTRPPVSLPYDEGQRQMILTALRETGGIVGGPHGAAARLGLSRTTLQSKMRRLGLKRPSF